jgi:thiol-disulfide isomerase/thioredoxin
MYQLAKLPEQQKFIASVKKEKFPNGKWVVSETINKFYQETDPEKKKLMLADILSKIESDENWKQYKQSTSNFKSQIAYGYMDKKDWVNFKKAVVEAGLTNKSELASLYNSAAWEMQKTSDNMPMAEEFSRIATMNAKEQWKNPTGERPYYLTQKQWLKNNEFIYAMYADTYGMVMYRMGEYKKGLPFAKDAAILINKGKSADQNNTYALLAEKVLPKKQYVKEIEQFVKDGKSTTEMNDILKRVYVKDKRSDAGFDEYIAGLQKESYLKMLEELRKSMLNETAPSFVLLDLDGKKINLAELKGKVVVVDFWATWCGPCKASFPGMQKMVNKYKEDQNVKFVFVDTWERGEGKEKNASDFISTNKYSFHVLMDNEDKVVAEFKVDGIPTKFVIDKKGMIRFKSVGFDGSDDKLVQELSAMIDMAANEESKKAF